MLRRSLRFFIPIAPRDVDRPEQYGKNDDTDPNRPRGSASGSRPTARAGDPFLLPNPIPKEVFPLEKHHFLSLYDIISSIDPTLEIKAHIADKSAYSYDMLVLTDRENGNPDYLDYLNFELRAKLAKIASTKTTKLKCMVEFFDKRELHIGFGVKGITPQMLNEEPNWAQRELLRSSLNYDWTKWELTWSHWFREVIDHLCSWGEYSIDGPDLKVERHYWAAQAFWARKKVYTDGTELYHFVCDNHVLTLHEMLPHPILRFEDLHSCELALKMKEMLKTPDSLIQIKQDKSMLTDEEVEYLRQLDIKTEKEYKERLAEKQREEDEIKSGKKKPGWLFY